MTKNQTTVDPLEAFTGDISWVVSKPLSQATRMIRHPDEAHPFRRVEFIPQTEEE